MSGTHSAFEEGKYWFTSLGLPDGVTAQAVQLSGKPAVRFQFTSVVQSRALVDELRRLATELEQGNDATPEDALPPQVPSESLRQELLAQSQRISGQAK